MSSFFKDKRAITNAVFGAVVAVLIITTAVGFGLYGTASAKTTTSVSTITVTSTSAMMETTTEMMTSSSQSMTSSTNSSSMSNGTEVVMFIPKSGAMISNAWLIIAPLGMNEYAMTVHAEGLEANGTYIVEGNESSGSMGMVPVSTKSMSMNMTSESEFQADSNGTGIYWVVLNTDPCNAFESIDLVYLPGMSMQNATIVATATLCQMMSSSSTMMTTNNTMMTTTSMMSGSS